MLCASTKIPLPHGRGSVFVHDEVDTNARKPSRDREEAEQLYWHHATFRRSFTPKDALRTTWIGLKYIKKL